MYIFRREQKNCLQPCEKIYPLYWIQIIKLPNFFLSALPSLSPSLSLSAAGSEHRFLAVGIANRWREIALLAAALGPLAYLAATFSPWLP